MAVPPAIRDAYDPERFRGEGHRLIDARARWAREPLGYLRSSAMNPLAEEADLDALLDHLRQLCRA